MFVVNPKSRAPLVMVTMTVVAFNFFEGDY